MPRPDLDQQMAEAVQRTSDLAATARRINRSDWTDEQWVYDAMELMEDIDGSVACLLNGHAMALIRRVRELEAENEELRPAPCAMTHRPPFDFAQCETHDETFPLGSKCRFDGREMWEVFAEEEDAQRVRAVRAEMDLDAARAELAQRGELVGWAVIDADAPAMWASGSRLLSRERAEKRRDSLAKHPGTYLVAEVRALPTEAGDE